MEVWKFIQKKLTAGKPVILMYVLQSEGSSPGRKGFKMAVASDDEFCGTIGGGIMEYKLVEKAKVMLRQNEKKISLQHQYHDKEKIKNQSGMICSGSQLNVFIPLSITQKNSIEQIISLSKKFIQLSPLGLQVSNESTPGLQYVSETEWLYSEAVNTQPVIHIIGGGHVGLALSELMKYLGFYIKLYDDRQDLNTITANSFADEIIQVQYENIASFFEQCDNDYVVIMTVGYRTDKIVLKQLVQHSFFYIGLLGSDNKINMLLDEMRLEGYTLQQLKNIHTPIGINIFSKTPKEIAVSIAAEIINVKNRDLPSGRK